MIRKSKPKIIPILRDSYLKMINNSLGARLFQNFYVSFDGEKRDAVKGGHLSCAFFVSSILINFNLIKTLHLTVKSTVKDMQKSGWVRIRRLKKGAIIVWEAKEIGGSINEHIGFYIGNKQVVSNNCFKRVPIRHHFTYGLKGSKSHRRITAIFWHPKLELKK